MSRDDFIESLLSNAEGMTILISSQEVNEIESLATHVAMIEEGSLLFHETADGLTGRFREVRVTLDREAALPPWRDSAWLQLQTSGNVLSFVESELSEVRFEKVKSYFSTARRIEAQTMGLRSIFTTLARTRQTGGPA
jgi:ABC-2 type transport system ATP-binding protein